MRRLSLKIAGSRLPGLGAADRSAPSASTKRSSKQVSVLGRHGRDHGPTLPARMIRYRANYGDTGRQSGKIQCQ